MRILPIIPNLYLQRRNIEDNNYSRYNLLRPPVADTFTGNLIKPIKAKSEFREHALKRIYNCMYCGIPMRYDETKFLEWKRLWMPFLQGKSRHRQSQNLYTESHSMHGILLSVRKKSIFPEGFAKMNASQVL